jgi:hypothetical protein
MKEIHYLYQNQASDLSTPGPLSDSAASLQVQSIFTEHELPSRNQLSPKERTKGNDGFFAIILFLGFILFVIVRVYSPRKLNQTFIAFVNPAALKQLLREEYAFTNRSSLLLLLIYLLTFPLFALQAARNYLHGAFLRADTPYHLFSAYLLILSIVFAAYLIKILTIRLMSSMFGFQAAGSEYIYTVLIFNKVIGLVIYPLVLLIAFAHQLNPGHLLSTGMILLVTLLVYRILRLIQIGLSTANVSFLYLFLYLCTLEILPFIVLIKLFMFSFS